MTRFNHAVILFARVPRRGEVKTRLQLYLDQETIFQLYSCFLRDSVEIICAVEEADYFIGATGDQGEDYFREIGAKEGIRVFSQRGRNLGDRMRNAFIDRFKEGYERVVIIGSDSPSLPVRFIARALATESEVVLGPSSDGGYYLIGMRSKVFEVFDNVNWGSERVLEQTLYNLEALQIGLETLPLWYDVDRLEDLRFLKSHVSLLHRSGEVVPSATVNYLMQLNLEKLGKLNI